MVRLAGLCICWSFTALCHFHTLTLHTCSQEGNVAYEGRKLSSTTTPTHQLSLSPVPRYPCSNFNIAFREALGAKKKFTDVFRDVMKKLGIYMYVYYPPWDNIHNYVPGCGKYLLTFHFLSHLKTLMLLVC